MRHRNKSVTLDRKVGPRRALLRGLIESVILYEKVQTTEAKAKAVKPLVEQIISRSKENTLHARREISKTLYTDNAVRKCMEVLGPRYRERAGGYTRIVKLGERKGDGAATAQIELV
ncbi:50S ribosomal protein L17 [Candidatus Uhrbacteria bacterium RIFCSPLOWO2_02_FULL_51_9]|uniref:Large ribosomal subunit protein bL17 n=1 Tax=Candidatus Uhrbacteria bacterium RIFCSPLOWO2_02_FULL_51_9 TaxID=1802410 RepID=A0A1F7VD85_9BACT|nr:MAG: 50S ribosomal protein L17 [Candidatus Uhrbacteria bacterium RIFCSPLOWO2_02_FULL_51_9]